MEDFQVVSSDGDGEVTNSPVEDDKNGAYWHSALGSLKARLAYAYQHGEFEDVTFLVGPGECQISANQTILSLRSPVLAVGFSPRWTSLNLGEGDADNGSGAFQKIKLPDIKPAAFRSFLKYLYTEELDTTLADIGQVLYISKKYQTDDLTKACYDFLEKNITYEGVGQLLQETNLVLDERMDEKILEIAARNAIEFINSDTFLSISASQMKQFLERDDYSCAESFLFNRVLCWAEMEHERRNIVSDSCNDILRPLIGSFCYGGMTVEEFLEDVGSLKILSAEEQSDILKFIISPMNASPRTELGLKVSGRRQRKRKYTVKRIERCESSWSGAEGHPCNHCFRVSHPVSLVSCSFFGLYVPKPPPVSASGGDGQAQVNNNKDGDCDGKKNEYKIEVALQNHDRDVTYESITQEGHLKIGEPLFYVHFANPVKLVPGMWYNINYMYTGALTIAGNNKPKYEVFIQRENDDEEEIHVKFKDANVHNAINQLPELTFEF